VALAPAGKVEEPGWVATVWYWPGGMPGVWTCSEAFQPAVTEQVPLLYTVAVQPTLPSELQVMLTELTESWHTPHLDGVGVRGGAGAAEAVVWMLNRAASRVTARADEPSK